MNKYTQVIDRLILSKAQKPFEITEENSVNINHLSINGLYEKNPLHDVAQRTFDRKDVGTAPTYQNAVERLANHIARRHVRQARMRCDHLLHELEVEAESAIGEFFAIRIHRFPTLAQDLLSRFVLGALPSSTLRALHRTARRACDARMSRMAGKNQLVDPSFFNLFTDDSADERSTELDAIFVNSRIDYLLGLVRLNGSRSGNANRSAQAHVKFLESARAYFLASIAGEPVTLPSAGLVAVKRIEAVNTVKMWLKGHFVGSAKSPVKETTGERQLAPTGLYNRIRRLAHFTGEKAIAEQLRFTRKR
jgi:hypothetical protein